MPFHTIERVTVGSTRIAFRRHGRGPVLLFIHGWPFNSTGWEPLATILGEHFTCLMPDSPGLGESEWSPETDFSMPGHARTMRAFCDALGVERYAVVAHDTGATIARLMAVDEPERVTALVLLNTEMPNHRPPFVPLFQSTSGLPGSSATFRWLLARPLFRRSPMGFGGCFHDARHLGDAFVARYVTPLLASPARIEGVQRYLRGVDWALVDRLGEINASVRCPVRLVWGADDPTFPIEHARRMAPQFPASAGIAEIPHARFLVHEERPAEVARETHAFLARVTQPSVALA